MTIEINHVGPNHYETIQDHQKVLQSYDSIIAIIQDDKTIKLSDHWDYSKTTKRYLCKWLKTDSKTLNARVKSGEVKICIDIQGNDL